MKILHLISSPRGQASVSRKLSEAIVEKLLAAHQGATVTTHNLTTDFFPHLGANHLQAFFTPADTRTPELQALAKPSDSAIAELKAADVLVIGAPMYNFSIHSSLKAWIDHVVRAGETFQVSNNGAEGLLKGKKAYLAISSGFTYSNGGMRSMDFVEPYLRTMLGFLGITDIEVIRAEGVTVPGPQETVLENAINSIAVQ